MHGLNILSFSGNAGVGYAKKVLLCKVNANGVLPKDDQGNPIFEVDPHANELH